MTYYVERSKVGEAEGPFTIEQINAMLLQKRLTFKSLAAPDRGQGLEAAQQIPPNQWTNLSDIPGYEPDPQGESESILLIIMICIVMVVVPVALLVWVAMMLNRIH